MKFKGKKYGARTDTLTCGRWELWELSRAEGLGGCVEIFDEAGVYARRQIYIYGRENKRKAQSAK